MERFLKKKKKEKAEKNFCYYEQCNEVLRPLLHLLHHYKDGIIVYSFKRKVKYNGVRSLHVSLLLFLFFI